MCLCNVSLHDLPVDWILRVLGERAAPNNIVNHPARSAEIVCFAGWVNYYAKADELIFYNDEYDDYEPPNPLPKPRRHPTTDQPGDYDARVREWEANKAQKTHVANHGSFTKAACYIDKVLPLYCTAYSSLVAKSGVLRAGVPLQQRYIWYLMEDDDASYSTRDPNSLPAMYRHERGVKGLPQPANSPDLNPIESIWSIIKERVKQRLNDINCLCDLKVALQYEWKQIRQEMVQERIHEMPYRCEQVYRHPRAHVKTDPW